MPLRQLLAQFGAEHRNGFWENGYIESFKSKLREELLKGEIFYNTERPHSSLGYKPPAPEAVMWLSTQSESAPSSAQHMAAKPIMH